MFICFGEWKIQDKLFSITLDNASYNDRMVTTLKGQLKRVKPLIRDGKDFQIRCCCHIVNLVVQAGLKLIDEVASRIRGAARVLKTSMPKRHKFYETAVKTFSLDSKKRLRNDCVVRWNSTFIMLDRALYFRHAYDNWVECDRDLRSFSISEDEWKRVSTLHGFLKAFYDITNRFSASKHPTSNIYFNGVWDIHMKLIEVSHDRHSFLREMGNEMRQKFDKYWLDYNLLLSCACVLDPRCKLHWIEYCYIKLFMKLEEVQEVFAGEFLAREAVNSIKTTLYELFECYSKSSSISQSYVVDEDDDYEIFLSKRQKADGEKSELDLYFEEKNHKKDSPIDILAFWKEASGRYPNLASMARDLLSIPISTVASESSFSMAKKLINPWRGSLSGKTIEAIACCEDWLRAKGFSLGMF
ncbi:hypothetical protein Dimus_038313 [Dionaea muscipula]